LALRDQDTALLHCLPHRLLSLRHEIIEKLHSRGPLWQALCRGFDNCLGRCRLIVIDIYCRDTLLLMGNQDVWLLLGLYPLGLWLGRHLFLDYRCLRNNAPREPCVTLYTDKGEGRIISIADCHVLTVPKHWRIVAEWFRLRLPPYDRTGSTPMTALVVVTLRTEVLRDLECLHATV